MVVDVFKRIFGRRVGVEDYAAAWDGRSAVDYLGGVPGVEDYGLDYARIAAELDAFKRKVEDVKGMLLYEFREMYQRAVELLKEGRREDASIVLSEAVLKKKLIGTLTVLSKLIEQVQHRLATARSAEEIAKLVQGLAAVMSSVNEHVQSLAPEVAVAFAELQQEADAFLSRTSFAAPPLEVRSIADLSPEFRELYRRALAEASKDVEVLERELPKPAVQQAKPVDLEELAGKLLEYIKANGGRLRVGEAAKALGVTPEAVRSALRLLERKGIIKLAPSRAAGAAQGA